MNAVLDKPAPEPKWNQEVNSSTALSKLHEDEEDSLEKFTAP